MLEPGNVDEHLLFSVQAQLKHELNRDIVKTVTDFPELSPDNRLTEARFINYLQVALNGE